MKSNTQAKERLDAAPCSACGGCGMIPGTGPNDDVMNTPCPECNPWAKSAHDEAWEKHFVMPIAKEMKKRGVAYLVIAIRADGKAAFVLDTEITPNTDSATAG
jgi:ssDNA-binding Zn-finger/Zn-ribbon topoisomerase 1